MIISAKHNFIFAAVPKTGTHAVRQALREHLGPEDLEQVGLFVTKRLPMPELAKIGHGHITLAEVKPHLPGDDFERFFKFGFVRNPFDRFISFCAFMTRQHGYFDREPQRVMHHFLFVEPPANKIHYEPQHIFFTGEDGALLTDYVGRVEEMQASYDEACRRIGIPSRALDRVNASRRGDYRQYYTPELRDAVAKLYARDLELFGYDF